MNIIHNWMLAIDRKIVAAGRYGIWALLVLFLVEPRITRAMVTNRKSTPGSAPNSVLPKNAQVLAALETRLAQEFEAETSRIAAVLDKAKSQLSVSTLVLTIIGTMWSNKALGPSAAVPFVFFLISVLLVVECLGIVTVTRPTGLPKATSPAAYGRERCNDLLVSIRENGGVADYLLNVYRAAQRAFLIALGALTLIAVPAIVGRSSVSSTTFVEQHTGVAAKSTPPELVVLNPTIHPAGTPASHRNENELSESVALPGPSTPTSLPIATTTNGLHR